MKNRTSFTLIELLLVIAVIAILASLLLPALRNARSSGQRVVCMNNQKQLAIGFMQYTMDYNGYFPSYRQADSNYMLVAVMIYLEYAKSQLFFCPSARINKSTPSGFDWNVTHDKLDNPTFYYPSYGTNFRFVTGSPGTTVPARNNQIYAPSKTVFQADTFEGPDLENNGYSLLYPSGGVFVSSKGFLKACHLKGVNVLWIDSHITCEYISNPALPYDGKFANGYNPQTESDASLWDRN